MLGNGYSLTQSIVRKSSANASIVEKTGKMLIVFSFKPLSVRKFLGSNSGNSDLIPFMDRQAPRFT